MNRLEFRVWDKIYDQYCSKCFDNLLQTAVYSSANGASSLSWCIEHPDDFEVERFINMIDIDEKKIFEGDKIEIVSDCPGDFDRFTGWHISTKDPAYLMIESPDGKDQVPVFQFHYHGRLRVIGNIHEATQ